jgi:hypothetical protein
MEMADTVTLGTVTMNGPVGGGQSVRPQPRFVSGRTINGTTYTYQKNDVTQNVWVLSFNDLTAAQKTALQTYFNDVAKGPSNTFSYTHTDATVYTGVRFIDNVLEFSRIDGGAFFRCSIKLLIAAEVDD